MRFVVKIEEMKCTLNSHEYTFVADALAVEHTRNSYFQLVQQIFRLDFEPWFLADEWDHRFIPAVLMENDQVVSSVAVCVNDILYAGQQKRYVQLSTVMTAPDHRNKGLNRYLMEAILNEWQDKCDAIYLLANDTVVDFYPKFGFEVSQEFQYSKPILSSDGHYRKLDIEYPADWRLILEKYLLGNPFSEITVENRSLFIFHCLHGFSKNFYYVEEYDAVAVIKLENDRLICQEVLSDVQFELDDLLAAMANEHTKVACLGFTPKSKEGYTCTALIEPDTHLFVLKGKENVFKDSKVMFPIASHA